MGEGQGVGKKESPLKDVYGGMLLGRSDFIKGMLKDLKEKVEGKEYSNKRELKGYIEKEEIIELIKERYCISEEELNKRRRGNRARNTGIYLMRRLTGLTNREIGEVFGMNFSAVSKAALSIETKIEKDKTFGKEINGLISKFEA
jgi:chromosomal replication initiation ATPase DnaA